MRSGVSGSLDSSAASSSAATRRTINPPPVVSASGSRNATTSPTCARLGIIHTMPLCWFSPNSGYRSCLTISMTMSLLSFFGPNLGAVDIAGAMASPAKSIWPHIGVVAAYSRSSFCGNLVKLKKGVPASCSISVIFCATHGTTWRIFSTLYRIPHSPMLLAYLARLRSGLGDAIFASLAHSWCDVVIATSMKSEKVTILYDVSR